MGSDERCAAVDCYAGLSYCRKLLRVLDRITMLHEPSKAAIIVGRG